MVEFKFGRFQFRQLSGAGKGNLVDGFDIQANKLWTIEVIGNIYENPDLLEPEAKQ